MSTGLIGRQPGWCNVHCVAPCCLALIPKDIDFTTEQIKHRD